MSTTILYSQLLHDRLRKRDKDSDVMYVRCLLDEIERLQAERRWIPVSERLPEAHVYVLVTSTGVDRGVYRMSLNGGRDGWQNFMGWQYAFDSVTHWMPLPPPPEEE